MSATKAKAEAEFPLSSFREAAQHLRRPFTPQAVRFKVQSSWTNQGGHGALIVAYIDARLVDERLNMILPHLWHDEYAQIDSKHMLCKLTVDGITRQDVGEGGDPKSLFSDALKRAAVKFGIGVSLYAIPKMFLDTQRGHLKTRTAGQGKTLVEISDDGQRFLREKYSQWLESHGSGAFGEPLDHGDTDDPAGDAEAIAPVEPVAPYGPAYDKERGRDIGVACKALCNGDEDQGRLLWRVVAEDHGGYMPAAAANALIRAANAPLLFPEVKAPEVN